MQTLGQRRARHAWNAVESAEKALSASDWEDYRREAKKLPVRIMTSGLGHAMAFMNAKGGKARAHLGKSLAGWLLDKRTRGKSVNSRGIDGKALCEEICSRDGGFLRIATNEALQYLQWLVRFAEAAGDETEQDA